MLRRFGLIFVTAIIVATLLLTACGGSPAAPTVASNAPAVSSKGDAETTTDPDANPDAATAAPVDPSAPTATVASAAPAPVGGAGFAVEINQAIGIQLKGAKNYAAGKATAILAFMDAETKVDEATTQAVVIRDGNPVTTLKAKTQEKPGNVVEFLCPDMPTCGDWQKGNYEFEVTVNGAKTKTDAVNFVESKVLRVLAVNVKAKYGTVVTQVQGDGWKTMDDFTRATYPIAAANLRWAVRDEVDGTQYDLETDEGRIGLWQMLTGLVPNTCQADPAQEGCYDMVVGFISDRPMGYPSGSLQGWTAGLPATVVVASDQDAKATVAHEIAHVFAVGDTYAGGSLNCAINPSPDGMKGSDWNDRSKETSCTAGAKQFSSEVSATMIDAASVHPYEVGGRGALPSMACFMGSGGKQSEFWVTPEVYDALFQKLLRADSANSAFKMAAAKPAAVEKSMLYYFGYIKEDGSFVAEPWYTFTDVDAEAMPASPSGSPVTIKVLGADGKELASKNDKVEFYPNVAPGDKIVKVDEAALEGVVDFPADAKKVQIVYQDKVIYEATVSDNKPVVSDVTPVEAAQKIDGNYKVTWKGSDADKDNLTYTIEFNPDASNPNSEWWVLADNLKATEWEEDLSQWPGGAKAKFRVTATDGILSGEAESQEFTVPFKAPEVVISEPEWGTEYAVDDEISLTADVYDMQDEPVDEKSIVWTSDQVATPLGYGAEIITSLPAGTHTITLTVKNSVGVETKVVLDKKIVVK